MSKTSRARSAAQNAPQRHTDLAANSGRRSGWTGGVAPQAMAVTFVARIVAGNAINGYTLDAGDGHCHAHRAASCLMEPAVGDRVACWRVAGDQAPDGIKESGATAYVVAVLERADITGPAVLSVAGDMELAPIAGALRLRSEQAVQVEAGACDVTTETLTVKAGATSFFSRMMETIGEACAVTVGRLSLAGGVFSTAFDRETHHAQTHTRQVDGIDRLQAHVVHHQARDVMQLQSANVLANGECVVKVQGSQIHFG